jgi:N utilization substance protein B
MGKRRDGREAAVQFLYQLDLHHERESHGTSDFWELRTGPGKAPVTAKTRAFTEQIIAGVTAHLDELDERIKKYTANYELHRLAAVDRNILRVAIYEMLHCPDVAPVIIINEAIEIAKKFGAEKSGGFVNGILDRVKQDLDRPARTAATG